MTDLKKKLDETKRQIRSLLESAPLGLTLQELKRDFKLYIGLNFPTRELGYSRDEEFLKDISDVVQISFRGDIMVLYAVSGKETEHLVNMINRQKIDPKKRWGVLKGPRYGKPYMQAPKPLLQRNSGSNSMDWRYSGDNYQLHYQQRNRVSLRPPPVVPAYIRSQIFSLVKDAPDGLPLIYFRKYFGKTFGSPLEPEKLGFSNEEEMLKSLSDMVELVRLGGEIRVMPLQASTNMSRNENNYALPSSRTEQKSQDEKQSSKATEVVHHCNIPLAFQNIVTQVISKFPNGIKMSQFTQEYKSIQKNELPTKTYGYSSAIEFLSDLPHILYIERPHPQGDWMIYPAEMKPDKKEKSTKKETDSFEDMDPTAVELDQATKEAIVQVLSMHKDGIALSKFESTFREMTGKPLNAEQYCEGGVKQLLLSLSDFVLISICPKEKYRVFLRQDVQVMSGSRKFDKLNSNYQPLMAQDNEQCEATSLPNDVVGFGCHYKPQPIPPIHAEQQYISLYVSYVISPGLFWIQVRGEDTTIALEDLMDNLEKVYESKKLSKDYFMTSKIAQKGLLCAAIFPEDGFWYRAVITDVKEPFYQVLYVDYGNSCSVSLNQLRLLKSKFIKFPAQAIQARLSHVHPVGETWAVGAKEKLLSYSTDKALFGLVTNIKDRVLSLCLVDTSDKKDDIDINGEIVKGGFGQFIKDDQLPGPQGNENNELAFGQAEPEQEPARTRIYIRQVKLTESIVMNLINLDDHPYLLSFEISKLFFQQDIIGSKLKQANVDVKKITVNKANYPGLFEELLFYKVSNITPRSEMLSLFSLSGFPVILKLFGKGDELEEMMQSAQDILTWFNPEDPYWMGEDSGSSSTQDDSDSVSSHVEGPTMEELNLALQNLRETRKGILDMMSRGRCGHDTVNALATVEAKIKKVEDYAKSQEKAQARSSSSSSSDSRQNYQPPAMEGASSQVKSFQQRQQEEALLRASLSKPSVSDISSFSPLSIRVPADSASTTSSVFSTVGQSSGLPSMNPALVNQQLLALLQQHMLQAQLQQSALGLQALLNPLSPNLNLFNAAGNNYTSYLLNDQLQASNLLLQNPSLHQQQMNAFASALASLSLGSLPPAQNLADGLRPPPARLSECNSVETQQNTSAATLTPLQHRQLLQQFQTNMTSSR